MHDNPFGMRLTTLMISKRVPDASVPMSLLADHPNVRFSLYWGAIGTCDAGMNAVRGYRSADDGTFLKGAGGAVIAWTPL
jgi:hypothetical protein